MWTTVSDFNKMYGSMDLFRSRMNRLFTDFDRPNGNDYGWKVVETGPKTNLFDAGDFLEIQAEVPGLNRDDINIKVQGNYLEITGERKSDAPKGYKAHRVERDTSHFTRNFTLPADIDPDKVEASLKNGILTLTLPKAEAAKPKLVTIN